MDLPDSVTEIFQYEACRTTRGIPKPACMSGIAAQYDTIARMHHFFQDGQFKGSFGSSDAVEVNIV